MSAERVEFLKAAIGDAKVSPDRDEERSTFYRLVEEWAIQWDYEVGGMGIHDLRERLTAAGLLRSREYVCTNTEHVACTGCDVRASDDVAPGGAS